MGQVVINAEIIADSLHPDSCHRIISFVLEYPRYIHAEVMTYRQGVARNSASSRAVPTKKFLEMVRTNPVIPIQFGKNQPGMQASEELEGDELSTARDTWLEAAHYASQMSERLAELGVHKQVTNRLLEPFLWHKIIFTCTEEAYKWVIHQRLHPDAQPEFQELARQMKSVYEESKPVQLEYGDAHLPFIDLEDYSEVTEYLTEQGGPVTSSGQVLRGLKTVSSARCARVSYNTFDGERSVEKDFDLAHKLLKSSLNPSEPEHSSPFEHVVSPWPYKEKNNSRVGPFGREWLQYRHELGMK